MTLLNLFWLNLAIRLWFSIIEVNFRYFKIVCFQVVFCFFLNEIGIIFNVLLSKTPISISLKLGKQNYQNKYLTITQ
jgi:hypothetical protein